MNLFGLTMQQAAQAPIFISSLLDDVMPQSIVEFGTGDGGLTVLLGIWSNIHAARIVTWDNARLRTPPIDGLLWSLNVELRSADYFSDSESAYAKSIFDANLGRCLILCDGGNKPREMMTFSAMLSPGDVIMAHDYAPTPEAFHKRYKEHIWRSCEVCNNSIPKGFEIYAPELAAAGWICLRHL